MIDHDLHIHTYLSSCCHEKATQRPRQILAAAEKMGLKTVGFLDHMWQNPNIKPSDWYQPQGKEQITFLRKDLESVTSPVNILIGCEADTIAPGKFTITREFAESLDYVGLSCSHFHMTEIVQQPKDKSPRALGEHLLTFFISAATSGLATVIVHPFYPMGSEELYDDAIASLSDAQLIDAFSTAAEQNVALEITTAFLPPVKEVKGKSTTVWSLETPLRFLSLAKDAGCKFTFGSDAHSLESMTQLMKLEVFRNQLNLSGEDIAQIAKRKDEG